MKYITRKFTILFTCSLLCIAPVGCSNTDWNLSGSGQTGVVNDDKIVIRSEQSLAIALDTFDTFLAFEKANRESLAKVTPKIKEYADHLRLNSKRWIKSLEAAHDAYKGNRSSLNHATLITAFNTVQAAITEAKKYMTDNSGV